MRTKRASLIEGFNLFDYKLFGINETEANCMDPQHKLLLECTYKALENAGMPKEDLSGSKTGFFIGLMNRDFEAIMNNSANRISHYNGTGTAMSIAVNRILFTFNFTGPSLAIDTACSSSLDALHYASQAIKQGDCEMAVCGGVSCIIEPRVNVMLISGSIKLFLAPVTGLEESLQPLAQAKEERKVSDLDTWPSRICHRLSDVTVSAALCAGLGRTNEVWGLHTWASRSRHGHCDRPLTCTTFFQVRCQWW
ncbi:highly reducing polyketide synthase-like isoform X2 [Callorhinchus milii]|uniref:highly reducing polyketide synthase-like isoform X2 n=1 Tax=Callorhinchus milii TaxID=7868 RepID=UPI001C3F7715|nr:highly reducing polyketide synthase-like isoform X2 [Callorhinchus milii]